MFSNLFFSADMTGEHCVKPETSDLSICCEKWQGNDAHGVLRSGETSLLTCRSLDCVCMEGKKVCVHTHTIQNR